VTLPLILIFFFVAFALREWRFDAERRRWEAERQRWADRVQAPEVAVAASLPEPDGPSYVPFDDDAAWNKVQAGVR
jgi:hypothetical protein